MQTIARPPLLMMRLITRWLSQGSWPNGEVRERRNDSRLRCNGEWECLELRGAQADAQFPSVRLPNGFDRLRQRRTWHTQRALSPGSLGRPPASRLQPPGLLLRHIQDPSPYYGDTPRPPANERPARSHEAVA